jgi:hypothetical protein
LLLTLLDEVVRQAALKLPGAPPIEPPKWDSLLAHIERPEGVYHRSFLVNDEFRIDVCVAWWQDRLGRRHWYAEAGSLDDVVAAGDRRGGAGIVQGFLNHEDDALRWVAPRGSYIQRVEGAGVRPLVVCRCGFVGSPESLGWMGECCGPCFDRQQEGLPPLGPAPLQEAFGRTDCFVVGEGGYLITMEADRNYGPTEEPPHSLSVWAPPYTSTPAWRFEALGYGPGLVVPACSRRHLALFYSGRLTVFPLPPSAEHWGAPLEGGLAQVRMVFAGQDSDWLVVLREDRLRGWHVSARGEWSPRAYDLPASGARRLSAWPGSDRVLVAGDAGISVRAASGAELERFFVNAHLHPDSVIAAPDGCIAVVSAGDQSSLARWYHSDVSKQTGWMSWLLGPSTRAPDERRAMANHYDQIALSPDNSVLVGVGWGGLIDFLDPIHFGLIASFRASRTDNIREWWLPTREGVAFSPDGQTLLVLTGHGLVMYPWRELLAAH